MRRSSRARRLATTLIAVATLFSVTYGAAANHGDRERTPNLGDLVVVEGEGCLDRLPAAQRELLADCSLVEGLRPAAVRRVIESGLPLVLPIAGAEFTFDLELDRTVFGEGALKAIEIGNRRVGQLAVSNTYSGSVRELEGAAAVTIDPSNTFLYLFGIAGVEPDRQVFAETISFGDEEGSAVLTYRGSDVTLGFDLTGDTDAVIGGEIGRRTAQEAKTHTPQLILGMGDQSFIDHLGSINAAFARMEFILTCIEIWYADFTDVDFEIAELWLHLFDFGPTDATELRDDFIDHMESSIHQPESDYHVAHLFTGVDMDGPIGKSQFPNGEPAGHYAVSQMIPEGTYAATVFGQGILVAHEVGHNYDATHGSCDAGPPPDIMCAGGLGAPETRVASFSNASVTLIDAEEDVKTLR